MPDLPRRTIEELLTLYGMERDIRDIFVEGEFDKAVVDSYLHGIGSTHVNVYEISTIDIETDHGGNRGRVVALANILIQRINEPEPPVLCIVDRDFDEFLKVDIESRILKYTDFCCMEMYFLDEEHLGKISKGYFFDENLFGWGRVASLLEVLQKLFFVRLVRRQLFPEGSGLDFRRVTRVRDGKIVLDWRELITRLLNANAVSEKADEFHTKLEYYEKQKHADSRHQIHGHDFVSLFCWFARKCGKDRSLCEERTLEPGRPPLSGPV